MGEISSAIIEGEACQDCGTYFGEAVGYPRSCAECEGSAGESFDAEADKQRRARNREHGFDALASAGYHFEVKNGAAHLIVETDQGKVDFWPGTKKWIVRKGGRMGRGVEALMEACKAVGEPVERPIYPVAAEVTDHYLIVWKPHMSEFTIAAYEAAGYTITGKP
jgi:hypothetical protein